jgi:hypothetical protein
MYFIFSTGMFPFQVGGVDIQEKIELPCSIEDYRCDVKLGVIQGQKPAARVQSCSENRPCSCEVLI